MGNGSIDGTIASNSVVVNNGVFAFNTVNPQNYAGAISGNGTVVKIGNGTRTLSGVSSFTGPLVVTNGTLKLANAVPTAPITAGLQAWFDASYGVTVNGNSVNWADKSGNNNDATPGGNNVTITSVNGQPAVQFASSYLNTPNNITDGEEYIVFKSTYNSGSFGGNWGSPVGYTDGNGNHWMFNGDGNNDGGRGPAGWWGCWMPNAAWQNGTSIWQGGQNSTGTGRLATPVDQYMVMVADPQNTSGRIELGGNNGGNWTNGNYDIAEVLVYNSPLTPAQQATVGRILGQQVRHRHCVPGRPPPCRQRPPCRWASTAPSTWAAFRHHRFAVRLATAAAGPWPWGATSSPWATPTTPPSPASSRASAAASPSRAPAR